MDDPRCEPLQLPSDRTRPAVPRYTVERIVVELDAPLVETLRRYVSEQGGALTDVLLSGWMAVLGRLSGQDEFVVSFSDERSERDRRGVPLHVRLRGDAPATGLLQQISTSLTEALSQARDSATAEVDSHASPVKIILAEAAALPGIANPFTGELSIALSASDRTVTCTLLYAKDLYLRETIERFASCWNVWLSSFAADTQAELNALSVLTDDERTKILDVFNRTASALPDLQVHDLFEAQVVRTPKAVAILSGEEFLTYEQLNARANRLARYLRASGVGPDRLVAVCMERSIDLVVAMLAVLKAGGAYVPLDPSYPLARLREVLTNAQPLLVLAQTALRASLSTLTETLLAVDSLEADLAKCEAGNLLRTTQQDTRNLAYVMHTSGSTGVPKGVMIEHASVVNFLLSMQRCPGMSAGDCLLAVTTVSFDISGLEIFLPLICGARLVLASRAAAFDAQALIALIDRFDVTVLQATPATWKLLLSAGWRGRENLKALCGGEALPSDLSRQILRNVGSLWNLYGPTETTIWSSVRQIAAPEPHLGVESVGGPIANAQIYILDAKLEPVPIGVAGEIYIGGIGVARGYVNRPDLTAERFVPNPFSTDVQDRLYRTGDVGRFRADGTIDYLGRNDHQVKIRGYRIELGEIEAQLVRHARVREAVVVPREDAAGDKRLVAYVVVRDDVGAVPTADELRSHLKLTLAEYMVPSAFVTLDRLPLTPNKKVDRRALPAPNSNAFASRPYEAPRSDQESLLATLWQELLGVERVGRQDNFFELGGHSLIIVQLMSRLRHAGWTTEVQRVFESTSLAVLAASLQPAAELTNRLPPVGIPAGCDVITPELLPLIALDDEQIDRIVETVPGGPRNIQDIYPLTPLQEGILFHHVLDQSGGDTYVLPTVLAIDSRGRLEELIRALQAVIDRHDILRTAIVWEQLQKPAQVVYRKAPLPVMEVAFDNSRGIAEQLQEWADPAHQHLDLRRAPLMRLTVAADPHSAKWYALLQTHHIVSDHESLEIVIDEVMAHLEGHAHQLPDVAAYRDHVDHALKQAQARDATAFFRAKLGDVDEPTAPFGLLEVRGTGRNIGEARREIFSSQAASIRAAARRLGVSPATLFHAAWGLVVARTSGRDDVVFGCVLLGRLQGSAGARRALGMFINTLPLRLKLDGVSALELVRQTQRELVDLVNHEQASLAIAQRCSGIKGSAPLFTALLNYVHTAPRVRAGEHRMARGIEILANPEWTNYPVVLSIEDQSGPFALTAQTNLAIEPTRILDYMETAIHALVEAVERSTDTPAVALPVLPPTEYEQVINTFNATRVDYPREELVHALVEEQARFAPSATAVRCGTQSLSYAELNDRANRLARALRAHGIRPDDRVAVYTERGVELVTAMLAVLKAGGAYVPLDPTYPAERLAYMIGDSAPVALLTQRRLQKISIKGRLPVIFVDAPAEAEEGADLDGQGIVVTPQNLAYVIYTSGSTGTPKGVMVAHDTVTNLIHWHCATFDLHAGSAASCVAAIGFDATVWEIWPALCVGATLVMAPPELSGDAEALLTWWAAQPLDVSFLPTPMAELAFAKGLHNPRLRTLLVGGDRLRSAVPRNHFALVNNYGPTESTVVASSGRLDPDDPVLHIGRPIANTRIYILDRHGQPVPVGVPGEICIGGEGLARGYLNRPQLTQERFVPDPFRTDTSARMYRTGDVARWRGNGTIEFVGRNDDQVKIRGFRIELGEIEARLAALPQVNEVVVLAREDAPGQKRLVAYLTCQEACGISVDFVRNQLKSVLPDYMIPSAFVILECLPLTAHGKVDRNALPVPGSSAYASRAYEPPQGQVEEILASIWQDLLHVEKVGRADNFFELGGHSLLIVQMMERLRRLGLSTDVRRVFESATLGDLARALTKDTKTPLDVPPNLIPDGCTAITPQMLPLIDLEQSHIESIARAVPGGAANIQDIYPLAPLQEGMLFHHLLDAEGGGDTYVVTTVLSLESHARLNDLIDALQQVIDRHDILRTAVLWEDLPRPVQVVYRKAPLPVDTLALDSGRRLDEQIEEWIKPERQYLDLRQAPLMRLQVAAAPHGTQWYALLQIHHIVDDGASLHLMISEVLAHLEGRAEALPEPVAFRYHVGQALAQARRRDSDAFFREKLGDIVEPTAPFGIMDVRAGGARLAEARAPVDAALGRRARAHARRLNVSVATIFHAAWAVIVAHTSAREDVVFGSVLLGRLQGSAGAKRIVGMFINTLPIRLRLADLSARTLVESTQRELVELFAHEQASLATAQRHSGMGGGAPLFSAVLNFRHGASDRQADWASAHGIRVLAGQYRTNYPISLSIDDLGDEFLLTSQTDRRIDPQQLVRHMHVALGGLVEALEHAPDSRAMDLPILSLAEQNQLLHVFNASRIAYPREATLAALFEAQVARTPNATAIAMAGTSLSFAELNERANQLAHYLRVRGVGPNDLVGVYLERGIEMLVGVVGILKAGGAYLPLDPSYPTERVSYMLKDAAPKVVLLQERLRERLPKFSGALVAIDRQWNEVASSGSERTDGGLALRPNHLAYVIYTSGSTGLPKGVMIEHRQVVNLWQGLEEVYRLSRPCERIALNASLSFDASVQQWVQLLSGRTIHLVPEEARRDASKLFQLLREEEIHGIDCTPSQLKAWLTAGLLKRASIPLRVVLVGGEAIDPDLWRTLAHSQQIDFYNVYGPTECTVDSTVAALKNDESGPHIGRPMGNRRIYILDHRGHPVPPGVAGEIYLGGEGVGRGYLNRPDLTSERFLSDPYSTESNARMYRSGDMGRWRADGTIEYLGRNDTQVKIRGFRIELGEIEQQLRQHPKVSQAIVVAREDVPDEKRLVAYVVADASSAHDASESKSRAAGEDMLGQWQMIHEQTYARGAAGPSFIGWNSSYTGEPIPEGEMQDWLNHTLERIRALHPQRVLEIGCGVGLLLQHLAPECARYVGTDFSAAAIENLGKWAQGRPGLGHVKLLCRAATELQDLPSGAFDTVILNSVVQYFPDLDYLLAVLSESVRVLDAGGAIFIGDVRHLGLLRTFHSAVQLSRAAATVRVGQLRNRIERALAEEKELVIDPRFFEALPAHCPGIAGADVQLKRGHAANELTRYRYDVVLRAGVTRPAIVADIIPWQDMSLDALVAGAKKPKRFPTLICAVPNARLAQDVAAERLIQMSDEALEAGTLRRQLSAAVMEGKDPEAFWAWASAHGKRIKVRYGAPDRPDQFDVLLGDTDDSMASDRQPVQGSTSTPLETFVNNPLETAFRQQLLPELREYLKSRLPEHMIPSAWVALRQLPLTPSGKVDHRALPLPQSRSEELGEYVAPRTALERTLADIWAEVLRVDQVGVDDDFFQLGGHSLLATQVVVRIQAALSVETPVRLIFDRPTVRQLASQVEQLRRTQIQVQLEMAADEMDPLVRQVAALPESEVRELIRTLRTERL